MKHKKMVPLLDHPHGRSTPPSITRRIFETWIAEIAVSIGTRGAGAQDQWMHVVQQARKEHEDWLELPP
eukprot:6258930-Prorocentrum_lima.AAC.1